MSQVGEDTPVVLLEVGNQTDLGVVAEIIETEANVVVLDIAYDNGQTERYTFDPGDLIKFYPHHG